MDLNLSFCSVQEQQRKRTEMRHVPFFIWPLMLVVGNMTLNTCFGSEERNFFQLPHPIKQLSLFSNACMFIFFAPSITWAAFQYVTYFQKMPSQHIFHDISENCSSLNFSILVCFSLIKLIKPLGSHFRNVRNSSICGIFFQQNETITTSRAPLWRGVVSASSSCISTGCEHVSLSKQTRDRFFLSFQLWELYFAFLR